MNPFIQLNHRVCNGKPVIAGTRIPVTVCHDLIDHTDVDTQVA